MHPATGTFTDLGGTSSSAPRQCFWLCPLSTLAPTPPHPLLTASTRPYLPHSSRMSSTMSLYSPSSASSSGVTAGRQGGRVGREGQRWGSDAPSAVTLSTRGSAQVNEASKQPGTTALSPACMSLTTRMAPASCGAGATGAGTAAPVAACACCACTAELARLTVRLRSPICGTGCVGMGKLCQWLKMQRHSGLFATACKVAKLASSLARPVALPPSQLRRAAPACHAGLRWPHP